MKTYILIAGANGVGKSTLYESMPSLKKLPRVNSDEIVRTFGSWRNTDDMLKAGKIALAEIEQNFRDGVSFNQETTLCGHSILRNIES